MGHLRAIAVEHERWPTTRLADPLLGRLTPPRVVDLGVNVGEEPVLARVRSMFQVVAGRVDCSVIFTIDLIPLKPYFHGTTSRSGAPFWAGSSCPYRPTAKSVSGCIASSIRRPSMYGQGRTSPFWPGIRLGSSSVSNATYSTPPIGSTRSSSLASGNPDQGITIDHPSTQRMR